MISTDPDLMLTQVIALAIVGGALWLLWIIIRLLERAARNDAPLGDDRARMFAEADATSEQAEEDARG